MFIMLIVGSARGEMGGRGGKEEIGATVPLVLDAAHEQRTVQLD